MGSFIEIFFLGIIFGSLSGIFGIGGGTILVPIMLWAGLSFPDLGIDFLDMKSIIAISLVQMLISSVYGSYINYKKQVVQLEIVTYIGIGAIGGGFLSSLFISQVSNYFLEVMFLFFIFLAFFKVLMSILSDKKKLNSEQKEQKKISKKGLFTLIPIGVIIGFFSVSIGVGGSIIVVPILISFFNFTTRMATATGLFFVMFSSFSGVVSYSSTNETLLFLGLIIGIGSLIGVRLGIYFAEKIDEKSHKLMLVIFYLMIAIYMSYRTLIQGLA